jgi:hypothetical protein
VGVGNVQRRRRVRPRGHACLHLLRGAAFAVTVGVARLDKTSFEQYVWLSFVGAIAATVHRLPGSKP